MLPAHTMVPSPTVTQRDASTRGWTSEANPSQRETRPDTTLPGRGVADADTYWCAGEFFCEIADVQRRITVHDATGKFRLIDDESDLGIGT